MTKLTWWVFGILVGLFLITVSPLRQLFHNIGDFRSFVLPLGILGAALAVLAAISKMPRLSKAFLIVTGVSSVGWPVSLYVHSILFRFIPTEPFTYIAFFYVFTPVFIISSAFALVLGVRQLLRSR